ncbi:MAG: GNAT family N-acetyltransferase [Rhodothermales bacterium]
MRPAHPDDIPTLLDLMEAFYAESDYRLDRAVAGAAFGALLADERLGRAWLIEADGWPAGYLVITVRFAMEFGGLAAILDDLYVAPAFRKRGLATAALEVVRRWCEAEGIRAMTVEVAPDNTPAQIVYRRAGFGDVSGRQLLALELAPPAHEG